MNLIPVWIQWIHDPFLDFNRKKSKILFWIQQSGFGKKDHILLVKVKLKTNLKYFGKRKKENVSKK